MTCKKNIITNLLVCESGLVKIFYLKTFFKHTLKKENCTITFVILMFNSEVTNKIVSILKKYLNFIVLKTLKNIF